MPIERKTRTKRTLADKVAELVNRAERHEKLAAESRAKAKEMIADEKARIASEQAALSEFQV